jgi:hypothetical protein
VGGALYLIFIDWAYDDPFITYRYAANLAQGNGFVYNPGERVLSTTTPLFALFLAVLKPIWNDLPRLAILTGAFSIAAGGPLLWALSRSWGTPLAGWTGLLLYPTFPLLLSTLGSETPLYLALALAALVTYTRRRYPLTALLAAATILTRPDGVLVAALLAGHFISRRKEPIPWEAVAVFVVPLTAWAIFAFAYFGSPIPVTLAAKQGQFSLADTTGFWPGLLALARNYLALPHYTILGLLFLVGVLSIVRRSLGWGLLALWTTLYTTGFTVLRVTSYFWYYAPLVPGLVGLSGVGISELHLRAARFRRPLSAVMGALLLVLAGFQLQDLNNLRELADRRFPIYQAAGQWLSEYTDPAAPVGTLEVGIIGYYTPNPMLDFAGLIQPQVAAQFGPGASYEDAALWVVENYPFEYLVLHDGLMPRLEADYAARHCSASRRIPGSPTGYEFDLVIYDCRD